MKFYPRLNLYKASNVQYNVATREAHSYSWYCLAKEFNGMMILNDYTYSPSTGKHVYKIKKLFDKLGINYIRIEAPRGLQALDDTKLHYQTLIANLHRLIAKPRSHTTKNRERLALISELNEKLNFINTLEA